MADTTFRPGGLLKERYRIREILGEGAYGTVYSAEDLAVEGASWAIKEIRESSLPIEERHEAVAQFLREADILKNLNHTGVPKIVDSFSQNGCHYMVMEHVEGRTLQKIMEEGQPDVFNVLQWALGICDILSYLHGQKPKPIIFRDLKPSNVMVTSRGRVLLVDFGIARCFSAEKSGDTIPLGTPGFAAPEQYGNAQTDARTDIYGLGATLYALLSGADVASFNFVFPSLTKYNSSVGLALEGIITRCLMRFPGQRYQSAKELRTALMPIYRRMKDGARPAPLSPASVSNAPAVSPAVAPLTMPVHLRPLPPEARLWNPPVRKAPLKIPFAPEWFMSLMEDLVVPAKRGARMVAILFALSVFTLIFEIKGQCHGLTPFSIILYGICCLTGLLSLPVLVVNRQYLYSISVIFVLSAIAMRILFTCFLSPMWWGL